MAAALCSFTGGTQTLRHAIDAIADGARHALPVGVACALVGVIIGVLTLTGAATNFAGYIIQLGEQSLFLSLLLTMLVCLVLGMGIPTIPNYIITSSLAAPALLELGVPLIVSHMFVFYFGIMADLTPPVALAAFAAAPIARESGMKIGVQAVRIALAGFIVPYMAVYAPALMLQGGTWFDTGYVVVKAIIAILLWGGAAIGYWFAPLNWIERTWAFVAAAFLVAAVPMTDEIGLGLGARAAAPGTSCACAAASARRPPQQPPAHDRLGAVHRRRHGARLPSGAALHAALAAHRRESPLGRGLRRRRRLAVPERRARAGLGRGHGTAAGRDQGRRCVALPAGRTLAPRGEPRPLHLRAGLRTLHRRRLPADVRLGSGSAGTDHAVALPRF